MRAMLRAQLEEQLGGPASPWFHLIDGRVIDHLAWLCDQWCGYPDGAWLWSVDALVGPLFSVRSSLAHQPDGRELIIARKGGARARQGDVLGKLWALPTRSQVHPRWALRERVVAAGEWEQACRQARDQPLPAGGSSAVW